MSFDWRDYVLLSEELAKRSEESCLRSSISRAYYGVFCIARNKRSYQKYKGVDVHGKVIAEYKSSKDKALRKVGWSLDELRKARNDADYNEHKIFKKDFVERMVILANQVLTKLGGL